MTRKHFVMIAETISKLPVAERLEAAQAFIKLTGNLNPLFDERRFLDACNIEPTETSQ